MPGHRLLKNVFAQMVAVEGQKVYHCIRNDITRRKLVEEELWKKREELAEIFSLSPDMICVFAIDTATFLKVNPAFTKTLGVGEDELLSRSFLELTHPLDVEPTLAVIDEKLKTGEEVINFVNRYRCADGGYRWPGMSPKTNALKRKGRRMPQAATSRATKIMEVLED